MRVAPLVHWESRVMVVIRRFDVFTTGIWLIKGISYYMYNSMLVNLIKHYCINGYS